MPFKLMMQNNNFDGKQNSYRNQKLLQETNMYSEKKCFSSVFQESNHLKPIFCLEMHIVRV